MSDPRALIAYLLFFPLAIVLIKRYSRAKGVAIAVVAGSCFLPEGLLFSAPGLLIDKERVTYLAVLIGMLFVHRKTFIASKPGFGLELLMLPLVLCGLGTLAINPNPLVNDGAIQSGLSIRWWFGQALSDVLTLALPYLIGRTMFRSIDDLSVLIRIVVAAGLVYFFMIVIEHVMAIPFRIFQFSYYIYGVEVITAFRWGLTMPRVFMESGHALGTFMAVCLVLAVGLGRAGDGSPIFGFRKKSPMILIGLLGTLNVGGCVTGIVMSTIVRILRPQRILLAAASLALFCCIYPALRMADIFPRELVVDFAAQYDAERARSLNGRFIEEDFVLGNLGDRLWFGWGHFSRIPGAGTFYGDGGEAGLDAWWVINTGMSGLAGTLLAYMFMAVPAVVCWRRAKHYRTEAAMILVGAVIGCISIRMVDLLVNGWWNCLPVFLAGALMGATALRSSHSSLRGVPARQRTTAQRSVDRAGVSTAGKSAGV